ncbi:MAG TPA: hypothetical protein VGI88_02475, partial [Verrucomicrobiae bacterium]
GKFKDQSGHSGQALRPGTYWKRLTNAPDRRSALHYAVDPETLLSRAPNFHPSFSTWRLRRLIR